VISLPLNYDGHEFPEKYLCHTRESALLSGIKFSQENKSIAEVGQHKASPLLAVASGYGRSACNAITTDRPEPVEGLCRPTSVITVISLPLIYDEHELPE
jgi:hypothetical protein